MQGAPAPPDNDGPLVDVGEGQPQPQPEAAEERAFVELFGQYPREAVTFLRILLGISTLTSVAMLLYSLPLLTLEQVPKARKNLTNWVSLVWLGALFVVQLAQVPLRLKIHHRLALLDITALPRANIIAHLVTMVQSAEWRCSKWMGWLAHGLFLSGTLLASFSRQLADEDHDSELWRAVVVSVCALACRMAFAFALYIYSFHYQNDNERLNMLFGRNGRGATDAVIARTVLFYDWRTGGSSSGGEGGAGKGGTALPTPVSRPSTAGLLVVGEASRATESAPVPMGSDVGGTSISSGSAGPVEVTNVAASSATSAAPVCAGPAPIAMLPDIAAGDDVTMLSPATSQLYQRRHSIGHVPVSATVSATAGVPPSACGSVPGTMHTLASCAGTSGSSLNGGSTGYIWGPYSPSFKHQNQLGIAAVATARRGVDVTSSSDLASLPLLPQSPDSATASGRGTAASSRRAELGRGGDSFLRRRRSAAFVDLHVDTRLDGRSSRSRCSGCDRVAARPDAAPMSRWPRHGVAATSFSGTRASHISSPPAAATLAVGTAAGAPISSRDGDECSSVAVTPGSSRPSRETGTACAAGGEPMCSVCLSEFAEGDAVAQLPCSPMHMFHSDCVLPWLRCQKRCPLCSRDVDEFPGPACVPGADVEERDVTNT